MYLIGNVAELGGRGGAADLKFGGRFRARFHYKQPPSRKKVGHRDYDAAILAVGRGSQSIHVGAVGFEKMLSCD